MSQSRINISDERVRRFVDAVNGLAADSQYIVDALTAFLTTQRPVAKNRLTKEQERFLIESGTFTAEKLAKTQLDVDRGSLEVGGAEFFLSSLCATLALDDVMGYLDLDEDAVRTALTEGRLYAVAISGQFRFPAWQFNLASPDKLLPGLAEVIKVVSPRKSWLSASAFMATPQSSLVATGRQTPVAWLRDGGDVNAVTQIVEADDWW